MSLKTPTFIPVPFAENAVGWEALPSTTTEPGRASWSGGFPPETATPESSGGVPPHRNDFQAVLNELSTHAIFEQSGSLYKWNAGLDYEVGAHVLGSDNVEYICKVANGVSGTVKNPVQDTAHTYWTTYRAMIVDMIYPVGSIYMTMNSTSPATLFGGTWTKIQGKFLLASDSNTTAGNTGGRSSVSLSTNNLPSHTHSGSTNITGNHTHNRGNMEISGQVHAHNHASIAQVTCNGAFAWDDGNGRNIDTGGWNGQGGGFTFLASRSWTGVTSANGEHSHLVTVGATGNGQSFSILPPYIAVNVWRRTA